MNDDYDPEKETVQAWVYRHLDIDMQREADAWMNHILHGDNPEPAPLRGILRTELGVPTGDRRGYEPVHTVVDEVQIWEDAYGMHARIPFSRVDRAVLIYFGIVDPDAIRAVRTAYRQKKGKRW